MLTVMNKIRIKDPGTWASCYRIIGPVRVPLEEGPHQTCPGKKAGHKSTAMKAESKGQTIESLHKPEDTLET